MYVEDEPPTRERSFWTSPLPVAVGHFLFGFLLAAAWLTIEGVGDDLMLAAAWISGTVWLVGHQTREANRR